MRIFYSFVIVLFLSSQILASSDEGFNWRDITEFKRYYELGVAVGVRFDNSSSIESSPNISYNLYYNLSPGVAGKMGLGINPKTKISPYSQIVTYSFEIGMRFKERKNSFSPYIEVCYNRMIYDDIKNYILFDEKKTGVHMVLGGQIKVRINIELDISINHILNSFHDNYAVVEPFPPFDNSYFWSRYRYYNQDLFNPTSFEMQIRFRL